jgi:transcription elongation factor GreA-like protein/transcription elongation GreA/GreB family factor
MTLVDDAQRLIARGDFGKLEDLWTDLITDTNIELDQYFVIADAVKQTGDPDRARLLLEILGEYHETQKKYRSAIEIQKHMLRYDQESPHIRKRLVMLYRKNYQNCLHLEDYLELSGLSKDEPIMKALRRLEEYLLYDLGRYFFFERYGLGQVVQVNPAKREIVVDFDKKKRHFLSIDVAQGLLTPVDEQHFLYLKKEKIEQLKAMASAQPEELVIALLRSFHKPLSVSEIKMHLDGIVEEATVQKFWDRVRKALEKHDYIKTTGRTTKTYAYVASPEDKKNQAIKAFHNAGPREKYRLAEEYAAKMPEVFDAVSADLVRAGNQIRRDHPGLAADIAMLLESIAGRTGPGYTVHDIMDRNSPESILSDMANPAHQMHLLSILQEKDPAAWVETATRLVFAINEPKLLDAITDRLQDRPDTLDDIYHTILATPKRHPKQFLWMLKKIQTGRLDAYMKPTLMPKLIDTLEYVRGVKSVIKSILSLANFDALVATADATEARRIWNAVKGSNVLSEFEQQNYMRIIEHYFPDFAEEKTDIIYATQDALKKKKQELESILSVEIPQNKKDIGRAREFGDLSENFEYKSAKEKQDQLYAKVRTIEAELQRVQLIERLDIKTDRVEIGTTVDLERMDDGSVVTFRILGRWDTDLGRNTISNEAPLAHLMLGRTIGASINIDGILHKIRRITKITDL